MGSLSFTMPWTYFMFILSLAVSSQAQDTSSRIKRQSCTCRPKSRCAWAVSNRSQTSTFVCDLTKPSQRRRPLLSTRASIPTEVRVPAPFSPSPPTEVSTVFPPRASETSSSSPITEVPNEDILNEIFSDPISRVPSRPVDVETQGHRLFTKSKKEFKDLRDYAR